MFRRRFWYMVYLKPTIFYVTKSKRLHFCSQLRGEKIQMFATKLHKKEFSFQRRRTLLIHYKQQWRSLARPCSPLTELTDPVSSPSLPSEKFNCRITVTCDLLGDWDGEPRGRASCSSSLSRSALLVWMLFSSCTLRLRISANSSDKESCCNSLLGLRGPSLP